MFDNESIFGAASLLLNKRASTRMQETMRYAANITTNAAIFRINIRNRAFRHAVRFSFVFENNNCD